LALDEEFSVSRNLIVFVLLALLISSLPDHVEAQGTTDSDDAAKAAVELSVLESVGDFNALYDRIHPDAHAVIPRAAAIG